MPKKAKAASQLTDVRWCGPRLTAELLGITHLSKEFTSWAAIGTYKLTFQQGTSAKLFADRAHLKLAPEDAGIYIWCARAPDAGDTDWFVLYLGKANNLRERFKAYINTDGTFGPKREKFKYQVLCDMHRRGFDMQIRWRKKRYESCAVDEAKKLAKYNFALNRQDNGGYRDVLVPAPRKFYHQLFGLSGGPPRRLADFPVCRHSPQRATR